MPRIFSFEVRPPSFLPIPKIVSFRKEDMEPVRYRDITKAQAKDTGMAMVLILLLTGFLSRNPLFFMWAIPVLMLNMIWPGFFRPLAVLWFGFSFLLGTVMSTILLTAVFILMVTPVALIRRLLGKDSLQLKEWKKDRTSVFKIREAQMTSETIKKPF